MSDTQPPLPAELATPRAAADRIAELEAERDELRGQLAARSAGAPAGAAAAGTVRMRVGGPHESMYHGGVSVGREWTEVPANYADRLQTAALESGVELEQEQGE